MNAFEKISNEEMMCIDGGFNPGVILLNCPLCQGHFELV